MKTNNREFIQLKYGLVFPLLFLLLCYVFISSKEILLVVSLIAIGIVYAVSHSILKGLFTDMRNVIDYISQDKGQVIKDGDLGLLYDEVTTLKKSTQAYENTIELEKIKLRKTIEDICHQLKTPLTSVSIYVELLMTQNQNHDYLVEIDGQIEKMKYLIQSLLKLAKLQNHQVEFHYEKLPAKDVIELSLQSIHSFIEQTQTDIKINDSQVSFYYDEDWMQEAFSNILKNSLEHNCSCIDVHIEEHQQYNKITIHNNGEEIDNKDLPHIFERFYHSSQQGGVGIGLALSKEIIERHHGDIIAYNQDGVVFEITFPKYQVNKKWKVS